MTDLDLDPNPLGEETCAQCGEPAAILIEDNPYCEFHAQLIEDGLE